MTSLQLIQKLLDLQNNYASTYRSIVTGERLGHALKDTKKIDVEAEKMREPLLEHVGHLPIIASFLHSHLEHAKEVNLGRVLIMLSVHDIGETVVGDVMAYKKNPADSENEYQAALKLLSPDLIPYYKEAETETESSFDAKFAKAVDSLAPFLHEIAMPKLTRNRFLVHGFGSEIIEKKKRHLFEWDSALLDIFETIMNIFRKIERQEPTGLEIKVDLE